jgi:capsular polysaccharide biosynthesis protein
MLTRAEVVQSFLDLYEQPAYLEIGVNEGATFNHVVAKIKTAVDPNFQCDATNKTENGQRIQFFELMSDEYFGAAAEEHQKFDVIYLDGLHTFEQTLRDLLNSIGRLNPQGVIVIDDVIPNSYHASLPDLRFFQLVLQETGSKDMSWMGDVYKLVFFIQSYFQQFSYATVKENHGQLVLWRHRRPASKLVDRKIEQIGRLEYCEMIAQREAFKITPLADIVAAVKAGFGTSQIQAEIPQAGAAELCAQSANWSEGLAIVSGRINIAEHAEYSLGPLIWHNAKLLSQHAIQVYSAHEERKSIDVAPIYMYAFDDITALPHGVIVVDGKAVVETLQVLPSPYKAYSLASWREYEACKTEINHPILLLEQPGIFNYGHWLLEMFPKIFPIIEHIKSGDVKIGLPEVHKSKFIEDILSCANVPRSAIYWLPDKPVQLKKALYVSPISMSLPSEYFSPWMAAVLNQFCSPIVAGSHQKIFVSRKDATARSLLNEDEIYEVLKPLGYMRFKAGEMSFSDQVAVFKGASHIIGVYGASLSNIVFSEPGTTVLNICPNNIFSVFFRNLASLRRLKYGVLNGEVVPGKAAQTNWDFKVDMTTFREAVDSIRKSEL